MFVKGKSGNPAGMLPMSEAQKESRKLTNIKFEEIANKYLYSSLAMLEKYMENKKNLAAIDLIVISQIYHALNSGDPKHIEPLMNRILGPPAKRIKIIQDTDPSDNFSPIPMTEQEKLDMVKRLADRLESKVKVIDVEASKSVVSREGKS